MRAVIEVVMLTVPAVALPLLGWWGLARGRWLRLAVSLILLVCTLALVSVGLGHVSGPAAPTRLEAVVLYGPVMVLVCGIAWLSERGWLRRHRRAEDAAGHRPPAAPVLPPAVGASMVGLLAAWAVCCAATSFLVPELLDLRRAPDDNLVLPLPDELTLVSGERSCGSELCSYSFVVGAPDGAPTDQVTERLWRHLDTKGWHRGTRVDAACRRPGWLFRDEACVFVRPSTERPGRAIELVLTSALTT